MRLAQRSSLLVATILSIGVAGPLAGEAAAQSITRVHVIEVDGPIDRPLRAYLEERLADAERAGAIVVLELDTPGALGQDGVLLAERVAHLEVPVLAWVGPVPAKASGAGLLLMLASSLAAVSPGSQTGPLQPVDVLRPDAEVRGLRERVEAWLAARGREVDVGAADRPLSAQQALDAGIAEAAAYTVPALLREVDGMTVRTPAGEMELRTRVATTQAEASERTVEILFEEPGLITRVLHAVATPSMVYFLLILGLAAIAFELTQPGFGFAGFSGIAFVALAVYGLTVAIPSWPGFVLMLVGIGLLMVDVRLRSLSWPTWAGLVAFGAGSVLDVERRRSLDPHQPLADRRGDPCELPVLRVRSHRCHPVARQDRRSPARADRPGRGGEGAAGSGGGGAREGSALARTNERRSDRSGHADTCPGRRGADPAGRGRTCASCGTVWRVTSSRVLEFL